MKDYTPKPKTVMAYVKCPEKDIGLYFVKSPEWGPEAQGTSISRAMERYIEGLDYFLRRDNSGIRKAKSYEKPEEFLHDVENSRDSIVELSRLNGTTELDFGPWAPPVITEFYLIEKEDRTNHVGRLREEVKAGRFHIDSSLIFHPLSQRQARHILRELGKQDVENPKGKKPKRKAVKA